MTIFPARRLEAIPESLISEAVSLGMSCDALNLASGSPDFSTPDVLKEKAAEYIQRDCNQYSPIAGSLKLRHALARKFGEFNHCKIDADREVTITCGTAEALFLAIFSVVDPGDEVIVFEPAFECYVPNILMASAVPRIIRLESPRWEVDIERLESLCSEKTRAIIINTPHNPTGKVFSRSELEAIAGLCIKRNLIAITDEIYEYITYDAHTHVSMASLPGMECRTITTGGLSKTFNCTGWRVGYCVAPPPLSIAIRKVHTYLTVCAPAPLQQAAFHAFLLQGDYYLELRHLYRELRDRLCDILDENGFIVYKPQGSYFLMASFTPFGYSDDREFTRFLAQDVGVSVIPEGAFCSPGSPPGKTVRFCFSRKRETLEEAGRRLKKLKIM